MNATASIWARAGSKGRPGKNTLAGAGRPCIAWTIDEALRARTVSRIVVSSDDPIALGVAERLGAVAHRRDPALASDDAPVDAAARDAAERFGGDPIVILYGNVPIRPLGLIDRAVRLLTETGADSVQSYTPVGKHHPWWTARLDADGAAVRPWEGETLNHGVHRRQDLPPACIPDGGVLAVTRRALFGASAEGLTGEGGGGGGPHAFLGDDRRGVLTGEGEVVDIDTETDRRVAEAILRDASAGSRAARPGSAMEAA